jgi:hypothetical protein
MQTFYIGMAEPGHEHDPNFLFQKRLWNLVFYSHIHSTPQSTSTPSQIENETYHHETNKFRHNISQNVCVEVEPKAK